MGRKPARREIRLPGEERARLEQVTGNPHGLRKHVRRARFPEEGAGGLPGDATRPPGKTLVSGEGMKVPINRQCRRRMPGTGHRRPWPGPWVTWLSPRSATSCAAIASSRTG